MRWFWIAFGLVVASTSVILYGHYFESPFHLLFWIPINMGYALYYGGISGLGK
jgi:hypothetical protein